MSAKAAPRQIPTSLNGKEISQTSGKKNKAASANGHHRAKRMHHPTNKISAFMIVFDTPERTNVTPISRVTQLTQGVSPEHPRRNPDREIVTPSQGTFWLVKRIRVDT